MTIDLIVRRAQEYMETVNVYGWLLYDYRGSNPVFWETVGRISNVTRPCWLWIPSRGEPRLLVNYVDQSRFAHLGVATTLFVSRQDMTEQLAKILSGAGRVVMEYSPLAELPRVSRIDSGTLELVRSLGVEVISSGDTLQYATQCWSENQLDSHLVAASKLSTIVQEAFNYIGEVIASGPTEYAVAEFIRQRFVDERMEVTDGPIVAVNEHSSDPHYEPMTETSKMIVPGDWILIDLWSRLEGEDTMFADITWTAYVGDSVPITHQHVFDVVIGARDAAVTQMEEAFVAGDTLHGWELDRVARDYISQAGYGAYFNHRLGHSLGREVHGNAVNLDDWETHDIRQIIPGVAVTVEPGIYLPEFGMRSEIDVYMSDNGPQITTEIQRSMVLI